MLYMLFVYLISDTCVTIMNFTYNSLYLIVQLIHSVKSLKAILLVCLMKFLIVQMASALDLMD